MKGGTLLHLFPLTGLGLMLVVLVVSIVRKVAQSEWDCSLTKKKEKKTCHCKCRALFSRKAPTKIATVSVGHFSLEKRRLKRSISTNVLWEKKHWTDKMNWVCCGKKNRHGQIIVLIEKLWRNKLELQEGLQLESETLYLNCYELS